MPQDKRPLGLTKRKQLADNTKVSKMVKDPKVGPNYSEFNKYDSNMFNTKSKNPKASDSAEYKKGYLEGVSNAIKGKLSSKYGNGKPKLAHFPFRGETGRYAEGRFEGEKRYFKKNK